jgi:hypothetical protein
MFSSCFCLANRILFQEHSLILFLFFFYGLLLTTEAMGIGGLRTVSLSHSEKVKAGVKTAKCTSTSQCA